MPAAATTATDRPCIRPEAVDRLRADLAGFTVDSVQDLLGPQAHGALAREQPWPARWVAQDRAAAGDPLAVLVAHYVLGLPVARHRLEAALPRLGVDGAVRLGLSTTAGGAPEDGVRPLVDLRPYAAVDALGTADWWVVSDLAGHVVPGPLRADHVLGVGGASVMLARCAFRSPVDRVLDLGTGCGVQALHASRHARAVTATDVSARALAFASLTLALAGVDADLRRGSLFEPVAGQQFDQVVSNPPFVITPRTGAVPTYEYRDAGGEGDELMERLVTGLRPLLAPGGTAQLLGNWEHRRGESWQERLEGWLARSGLDGWVLQRDVQDPAEYAEMWIRDGGRPDDDRHAAMYRAWWDDFARRGVEAVGLGLVVLRRPDGDGPVTVRRVEEVRDGGREPLGGHLQACLEAQAWLARTGDDALLATHLVAAPDVTDERYHTPGAQDPQVVLLSQGGGFARSVRADTALAAFAGACDGELSVGRIAGALAVLLEQGTDEVLAGLLPAVRALVADGFLVVRQDG